MLPSDPITQVIDALWAALESNSAFTALVKVGNRIKITGDDPAPIRTLTSVADKPEVMITLRGAGTFNPRKTSDCATLAETFEISVSTSEMRIQKSLGPIKFAILCALVKLDSTIQGSLPWVTALAVDAEITSTNSMRGNKQDHGADGWSTIVLVRVDMTFSREEMIEASA